MESTQHGSELNTINDHYKYVIIGGGVGTGYGCNEFVKHQSPNGELLVISSDKVAPYERPALSKAYLHPPDAENRARLPGFHTPSGKALAWGEEKHADDWYKANGIDLLLNTKVTNVDLKNKRIETDQNKVITCDKLLIGTGSRPVMPCELNIKGTDLQNVFTIRLIEDSSGLVKALESKLTTTPVIVGGGYLGMECAAGISGWKHIEKVYMIFPESRLLQRLFPPKVAEWFETRMKDQNIQFIKEQSISEIIGSSGKVTGVKLSNGQTLEADMVIAAVGAAPNVELFKEQLEMAEDGGIKVDSQFRTSIQDVYAFGDVASFPSRYSDAHTRYEHVDNGRRSAVHLVKCMLTGNDEDYDYTPYFYSRIFEYTDSPLIFRYFGKNVGPNGQALKELVFEDNKRIGVFWIDENKKIFATMVCNGTEENVAEMEKLAQEQAQIKNEDKPVSMLTSW